MNDIIPQIEERTALYYPYLVPQDNLWLKQALLYWDKIGSFVPEKARSIPGLFTNDLEYLESEGIFFARDPANFSYLLNPNNIREDIKQILTHPQFPSVKKHFFNTFGIREQDYDSYFTSMSGDKLTPSIIHELQELGINIIFDDKLNEYRMGVLEAGIYMSVYSKHFAGASSSYIECPTKPTMVPVTDSRAIRDLLYCTSSCSKQSGIFGINLILNSVFPAPGPDVSLADILEFKVNRKNELLQLRKVMDEYYSRLSRVRYSDELEMASNDIATKIIGAVNDLTKTMAEARMAIIHSSAELLLNIATSQQSPSFEASVVPLLLRGCGALISAHKCYLNVEKLQIPRDFPYTYLLSARSEFGS